MLSLTNDVLQDTVLTRQQKRDLERKQKKEESRLKKALEKFSLPVSFDNETVTAYGPFGYFEAFKKSVGLTQLINRNLNVKRHHNCFYSTPELMDFLIDNLSVGLFRFYHMEALQSDPGYKTLKNFRGGKVPDESTVRYLFSQFTEENIIELQKINQSLLSLKASMEKPREVWLDFDDTVVTVFGSQEESAIGYNPRYHGRPSYKIKVGFISGTGELLKLGLYNGRTASNGCFLEFLKQSLTMLPQRFVANGVRMDKGFFDEKNFNFLEDQCLQYVCKAPIREGMKKIIAYLNDQKAWTDLDKTYSTAEITVPLPSWEKARRFIFIREADRVEKGVLFEDQVVAYRYQAIVTNMESLTPEEIWHWYNKRCNVENKIDELKKGLALEQASQHKVIPNQAFAWIKGLAYNLLNWFKILLPEDISHCEIPTARRKILQVPGNMVGTGRYRHLRLAQNTWLEKVITIIRKNLRNFVHLRAWATVLQT